MSFIKRGAVGIAMFTAGDLGTTFPPVDVSAATSISLPAQWNVLTIEIPSSVTSASGVAGLKMPPDADTEIGDVLEIYMDAPSNHGTLYIVNDDDSEFNFLPVNATAPAFILRKLAANTWRIMGTS